MGFSLPGNNPKRFHHYIFFNIHFEVSKIPIRYWNIFIFKNSCTYLFAFYLHFKIKLFRKKLLWNYDYLLLCFKINLRIKSKVISERLVLSFNIWAINLNGLSFKILYQKHRKELLQAQLTYLDHCFYFPFHGKNVFCCLTVHQRHYQGKLRS